MDRAQVAFPFEFSPDGFATVEQGTDDDIASCIAVALSWPLGDHPTDPNFGCPDQSFGQGGANLEEIRQAIIQSEPRARNLTVIQDDSQLADLVASVQVGFTVQDTGGQ